MLWFSKWAADRSELKQLGRRAAQTCEELKPKLALMFKGEKLDGVDDLLRRYHHVNHLEVLFEAVAHENDAYETRSAY